MEIKVQSTELKPYVFNEEELKQKLVDYLDKYQKLVFTEETVKDAKNARAELNKLSKGITSKVTEIKKHHLIPFTEFKGKTDGLLELIAEPLAEIDKQIKAFEIKQKEEKNQLILDYWNNLDLVEKLGEDLAHKLELKQVFDDKWLNATVSMKKIKEAINTFVDKVDADCSVINDLDTPFTLVLFNIYFKTFNLTDVMTQNNTLIQEKKEADEKEAKRKAEQEAREAKAKEEAEAKAKREAEEAEKQAKIKEDLAKQQAEIQNDCLTKEEAIEVHGDVEPAPETDEPREIVYKMLITKAQELIISQHLDELGVILDKNEIPYFTNK